VTFEVDPAGPVRRFRLAGPDLLGRRLAGVYDKAA
jgi:hypothetical protein